MCAIAGILDLPYDPLVIRDMLRTMKRRGPDGNGYIELNACCLLHSRLAVIDPIGGKQPMELSWAGECYVITYNGELYNTEEIRSQLTALGHSFIGHSDTEVVLHAYAQWGSECLGQFNGIFAFAVWETRAQRLFLARDRMGVKPLFYRSLFGGLLFASEIKTILAYPNSEAELDADGIAEIILLGPGRTPGSGVFRNIFELEPGQYGYYQNGKLTIYRYWMLKDKEHTDSFEETAAYIRYLVTDSIKRQMVSDVPIGTFLSGGLDSSLITAICAEEMSKAGNRLSTFSVDYKDNHLHFKPEKFQPNSDHSYIELMRQNLTTDHNWTILTTEDLIKNLSAATAARDLPGMADIDFSLLAFSGDIRRKVTVALSGECADEIFGGYPWYRDPEVLNSNGFPWAQNTEYRSSFLHPDIGKMIDPISFVQDRYWDAVHNCDIIPGASDSERKMKQMVYLNYSWFMQTLLDRKDRMSMYHGLEVRVPFCDYRIAEYLYAVPWEYKDYRNKEKGLLRYAMEGILPSEVLWRKKSPYPKTYDPAYFELVKQKLNVVIEQADSPILQIITKESLIKLLDANNIWPWYGQLMRVPQTIAYMLQINCWLEMYKIRIV